MTSLKKRLPRYKENVRRMAFALSISQEEMDQEDNPKVKEMTKLLEIASDYWHSEKSQINRRGNKKARKRFYMEMPPELAALRIFIDVDKRLLGRKPIKRCHKCYATGHDMKFCPDKKVADRTPEVKAMIKQRFEQVKALEHNDPLLSRSYKHRHFFKKEKSETKMKMKELKKAERKLFNKANKPKPVEDNHNVVKRTNAADVTAIQPEVVFQGGAYGNMAVPTPPTLPFLINYYGGEAGNMWMHNNMQPYPTPMQGLAWAPYANYGLY